MPRHAPICKKFYSSRLRMVAIDEAKRRYDASGEKLWVYNCQKFPCVNEGLIHLTSEEPKGARNRFNNKKLHNYYAEKERFGKGTSARRHDEKYRRRRKVLRSLPIYTWEDDGGAMHPRDLP